MLRLKKKKEDFEDEYFYQIFVHDPIDGELIIGDAVVFEADLLPLKGQIYEGKYALVKNISISEFERRKFQSLDIEVDLTPSFNPWVTTKIITTIHFKPDLYSNNSVNVHFQFDLSNWNHHYSPNQFYNSLSNEIQLHPRPNTKRLYSISGGVSAFNLDIKFSDKFSTIDLLYTSMFFEFQIYCNKASQIFENENNINNHSLSDSFEFPSEIQTACEQYLVYFAQFLRDIGINASTSVSTQAKKTLFVVTPNSTEDALSSIREALNIYLRLPEAKELDSFSTADDLAVQQLKSNVMYLKSQLMLAHATIESKSATLQSLMLTNFQQSEIIESQSVKLKNSEPIGDLVTVKEYDGKWFKLNLPEILRKLKRKL